MLLQVLIIGANIIVIITQGSIEAVRYLGGPAVEN